MKTILGDNISKIGIGSFGIGGRGHRDVSLTEKQDDKAYINALVYTLQKGINFTEISLGYGHGQAMTLFNQALKRSSVKRESIFLTHSLYPRDIPSLDVLYEDISNFYKIMDTEYADSTLITESLILKLGEQSIYSRLHDLLKTEKTRYVSLSNASPDFMKKFKLEFGDSFYAHEGHLSFEIRAVQNKGVFETCDKLGIKNIIWRPLGRNKTLGRNWNLLIELAKKYNKTQSQVILNWMLQLGLSPMVLSLSKDHIDENLMASEFNMSDVDYQKITNFRPSNFNPPTLNWDSLTTDDDIVEQ